ncbi:putative nucleotidyltransferase, Ribonuclease H [Helianthus annuus]|nr:putative nucleotidyltransferase, Ribonuclease H [Helianthus annuus]
MKGQILADFLAEVPKDEEKELLKWEALEKEEREREDEAVWKLLTDGASSEEGSGAGITLVSPEGVKLTYAIRLDFENTNNTAEYEALLARMRLAQKMRARHVEASTDSQLVVKQYQGEYEAKDGTMAQYVAKVKEMAEAFKTFKLEYIPRGRNRKSDALSKLASVAFGHLAKEIKVEVLTSPSLNAKEVATIEGTQETWMTPIIKFLRDGILPEGEWAARKIRVRALQYELIEGEQYRRSYLGPSLKCVDMEEAEYVVREMHEGICGMHSGPRTIVRKAMSAGFYWPRMYETASEEIKKCDNCQVHAPMTHRHKHPMVPVSTSWPFQKWAIDIIGPFPEGPGGVKYVVVAIDYFTKWIEARPLAKITGEQMRRIVLDNIICRYGVPKELVSDNRVQFAGRPFKPWCEQMRIQQVFTSVTHSQSNGLVERANQSIIKRMKGRLGRKQKGWLEELPFVLWAYRTTPKSCNGETPFSLTYGTEAVIPAEIGSPTARMKLRDEQNEQDLRMNINLLEERREIAAVKEAQYKKLLESYYNARMKKLNLIPGDLVLRANEASLQENTGKLGPSWEGPYRVTWANGKGTCKLETLEGKEVPRTWNLMQLRKYYV